MTDELKPIMQLIDDMRDNRIIEAAILAHVQAAIDAALENVAQALENGYFLHEYSPPAMLAKEAAEIIRGNMTINPLADAQARIAELERERDRAIQQHERCAEKLFNAERERDEARKDAERYRWLRDEDNWGDDTENRWAILGELTHGEFDNWIDAAMLAEREKE